MRHEICDVKYDDEDMVVIMQIAKFDELDYEEFDVSEDDEYFWDEFAMTRKEFERDFPGVNTVKSFDNYDDYLLYKNSKYVD